MEEELIKKLNSVSRINIKTPGHRVKLRIALLEAHENIRKSRRITAFAWKLFPVSALALMLLVLGFSHEPPLSLKNINTISEAKQILQTDEQTRSLIASGAIVEDTKIIGNRAYVLIQLSEKTASELLMPNKAKDYRFLMGVESSQGKTNSLPAIRKAYLVEIDLINKKVVNKVVNIEEEIKQEKTVPDKR